MQGSMEQGLREKLLIGADPELFVELAGSYVSGHMWSLGTKEKPTKKEHGSYQNDGLAVEFNTPPVSTKIKFVNAVQSCMAELKDMLPSNVSLRAVSCAEFTPEYLASLPKHVRELGCNPDMDAWTVQWNPPPDAGASFRTGSGHIHLGWTKDADVKDVEHIFECACIARELDYYVGLPSLLWDRDNRRRQLYGKAGAFRPKSYGLEYRVLSNAWLNDTNMIKRVFDQTKKAFKASREGGTLQIKWKDLARTLINSGDGGWSTKHHDLARDVYGNGKE